MTKERFAEILHEEGMHEETAIAREWQTTTNRKYYPNGPEDIDEQDLRKDIQGVLRADKPQRPPKTGHVWPPENRP